MLNRPVPANPLKQLQEHGQSVWLDYIRRSLITSGDLGRLAEEDGLRGVTSNPTIFEKAIAGSTDYDEALRATLAGNPGAGALSLYETLAIEDIRMAADSLRPVYERTAGADGFVSLEVSPHLAHDTAGTVAEARRLWQAVSRPNLMIKVPATPEGIPAIEALIAGEVNVNVTLMFSLAHYEAVAQAYLRGLERCEHPERVASVASFFVSRVDTAVDRALEKLGAAEALALRGQVAIANSKRAYRRFRELFYGEPFARLRRRGAGVQRPLWASTSTKNPAYRDVLYVEELIGPDTVNTMPPAVLDAFRDHGQARGNSIEEGAPEATLNRLAGLGVDLNAIAGKLQADGVASFAASFDQLLAALEKKREAILSRQVGAQNLSLAAYRPAVEQRMRAWEESGFACKLWRKDPALWRGDKSTPELVDRLGWLALPETMQDELHDITAFSEEVRGEGFRHAVLLGMGGSSLAPEVFQTTFGNAPGYPELIVLDSTHPAAVKAIEARIDPSKTFFVVSSKSGTTTETLSFFYYFWNRVSQGSRKPGRHFIAITDPGTPLVRLAREREFRRFFEAPPDVGGRYSALTVFGLVPAALIGVDVHRLLDRAWRMGEASAFCVPASHNPGLDLGAALGELALAGRDKVTFFASRSLTALPAWIEQLIAESTGKNGKGIVPVAGDPPGPPEAYRADRLFVHLCVEGEQEESLRKALDALEAAGHPVVRIQLSEKVDLGQEFFRWEFAVAAAGAILGINPFDQPDVQVAKELARKAMQSGESEAAQPGSETVRVAQQEELKRALESWLGKARPGDYIGLQAYLAPTPETTAALEQIRLALRSRLKLAATVGYGPRFLHSTGQLHKGGADTGLFLQLVDDPADDLAVPETDYTFGSLIRAQAVGDYRALVQRGRRALRLHLGKDAPAGLERVLTSLS